MKKEILLLKISYFGQVKADNLKHLNRDELQEMWDFLRLSLVDYE